MAAWNSSSLGFSDHNIGRHSSGLMKNLSERISKQHIVEHKLFGSKRGKTGKLLKIGKLFRKSGKGISQPNTSPRPGKNMKYGDANALNSSTISPSTKEFDKMMGSLSSKGFDDGETSDFNNKKRKLFSRKSFG